MSPIAKQRARHRSGRGDALAGILFRNLPDHCYVLARDRTILEVNDRVLHELIVDREELIGQLFHPLLAGGASDTLRGLFDDLDDHGVSRDVELRIQTARKEPLTLLFNADRLPGRGKAWYVLVGRDVSHRSTLSERQRYLASHDPLTGLYNRHFLEDVLGREVQRGQRYGHPLGVILLDVDHLKRINDAYGHLAGDEALRWVARHLLRAVRESDIVVRYGGDEFLVLMPETNGEVALVLQRIRTAFSMAEPCKGVPEPITVSAGEAYWIPSSGKTIRDALDAADRAMYASRSGLHA